MNDQLSIAVSILQVFIGSFRPTQFTLLVRVLWCQFSWFALIPLAFFYVLFFLLPSNWSLFLILFIFRYLRLLVNLVGYLRYKLVLPDLDTPFLTNQVTVIVPTVDPGSSNFKGCINSILEGSLPVVIIVAAGSTRDGRSNYAQVEEEWRNYPRVRVIECEVMNKRKQLCKALHEVKTPITIFCDDHVFWPKNFLSEILAPFTNPSIGIVGTAKCVRRTISSISLAAFCNVLGCLYIERNNFDTRTTYAIDGGVSVISGRTSAHRTCIVQDPCFLEQFTNDYCFFGLVGPLNCDDDNFITRWNVNHGWKIGYQDSESACIETNLGDEGLSKFMAQNVRWMRTRWRSNTTALFGERIIWRAQPWCVYAIYLTSFVNLALFYDAGLVYSLWSALEQQPSDTKRTYMTWLSLWIFTSKLVKVARFFWRNPRDLIYLPSCILFGYFHSFIKLYALLTFWEINWGSRVLVDEKNAPIRTELALKEARQPIIIDMTFYGSELA